MNIKIFSAVSTLLFKYIRTADDFNYVEYANFQRSNFIEVDRISIPSDFMDHTNNVIICELLESNSNSIDYEKERTGAKLLIESETVSAEELIKSIKNFVDKHFSSQNSNYPDDINKAKSIIDAIYEKLYEIDATVLSRTFSNISNEVIDISLKKIMKELIFFVESDIFKDLTESNKKRRLALLSDLLLGFKSFFSSIFIFLNKYYKIANIVSRIEQFALKAAKANIHSNQVKLASQKLGAKSKISNSSNLLSSSDNLTPKTISLTHIFTCKNPLDNSSCIVKSFCKSNDDVWYFAITSSDFWYFYILKIDQKNLDKNDLGFEIIKNYSIVSENGVKKISFYRFCKKIIVNPAGILYILKHTCRHVSFEILALDSNFCQIKMIDRYSFVQNGLLDSFIEDIEMHSGLLYMLDSKNKRIIVTDFDFNVKHMIKLSIIEFDKFKNGTEKEIKSKMSLIVTENSFYICFNDKMYTCQNNTKSIMNSSYKTVEETSNIYVKGPIRCNSFESIVFIGNNNFISRSDCRNKSLTLLNLVSTMTSFRCVSENRRIELVPQCPRHISFEIAAVDDHTIYLAEGGPNIKLFKLDRKDFN